MRLKDLNFDFHLGLKAKSLGHLILRLIGTAAMREGYFRARVMPQIRGRKPLKRGKNAVIAVPFALTVRKFYAGCVDFLRFRRRAAPSGG